ncbi:MAG: hypothetical protein JXL97_07935 [Bacteroidales bacterium]|nr:hypothetical protein [Bacteroidales bacterium]
MKIENFQKAAPYRLFFPVLLIATLASVAYFFVDKSNYNFIWLGLGVVFAVVYVLIFLKKPHYFEFEAKHRSFIIRFFNPHPFLTKHKAFEVSIEQFDKYEIVKGFGGLSKNLVLYIKKGKSTGAYPSVSVTLLNENKINLLKKELDSIIKMKSFK